MTTLSQLSNVGAGFWALLILVVLAFGVFAVLWAALRNAFGPRARWREDAALQQRIREELRKDETDPWRESGERLEVGLGEDELDVEPNLDGDFDDDDDDGDGDGDGGEDRGPGGNGSGGSRRGL